MINMRDDGFEPDEPEKEDKDKEAGEERPPGTNLKKLRPEGGYYPVGEDGPPETQPSEDSGEDAKPETPVGDDEPTE